MNIVSKAVDVIRTAPYGYSLLGLDATAVGLEVAMLHEAGGVSHPMVALAAGAITVSETVLGAYAGTYIADRFSLKRRLEQSIEGHGFDERAFGVTTTEWCDRQTASVVCRNAGVLPEYEALCDQKAETARLRWLPHF